MTAGRSESDVLIVGGGMVGASLAVALAPLALRIAVVEAAPPRDPGQPSYDDRSTAVSWGSRQILAGLGVWPELERAATPIRHIHVSDRGRFGVTRLSHAEQNVPALGYVVANRRLGETLWRRLRDAGVEVHCPARIGQIECAGDFIDVSIERRDAAPQQRRCRLLVVADGARSQVRAALNIDARVTDYGHSAVIANVTPDRLHGNVAYERFTATGPLAFLPMSNGRCSVVWTVAPETAAHLVECSEAEFLAELQTAFGYRLGKLAKTGARQSYPLSLVRAERIHGPRHVLIGNAAHSLHPVAGQGFNLGLRDVAVLADVVADAADPGAAAALRRYVEWRRDDHRRVVGLTDGLVRLFTADLPPVRLARGAGLFALDLFGGARSLLARQSMGLRGPLPRLARGVPLR